MARPKKSVRFSATIGDLCFYQRNGKTYMREAKALDREVVLTDDRFEKTRQYANKMAMAAKIGSEIYKQLPAEMKARWIFRSITGHAASLLYKGENPEAVKVILYDKYIDDPKEELQEVSPSYRTSKNYRETKANKMLRALFHESWKKQGKRMSDFSLAWEDPRSYNADNRKHFNHIYEFLEERFSMLQYINMEDALGKRITPAQLNKLLSE